MLGVGCCCCALTSFFFFWCLLLLVVAFNLGFHIDHKFDWTNKTITDTGFEQRPKGRKVPKHEQESAFREPRDKDGTPSAVIGGGGTKIDHRVFKHGESSLVRTIDSTSPLRSPLHHPHVANEEQQLRRGGVGGKRSPTKTKRKKNKKVSGKGQPLF